MELLPSNLHVFPDMVAANSLAMPDISCSHPTHHNSLSDPFSLLQYVSAVL